MRLLREATLWTMGVSLVLLLPFPSGAQAPDGTPPNGPLAQSGFQTQPRASSAEEGALFLLLPSGAQGVALGRAMTAISSSESAFWNPAGLANLQESRLLLFRGEHLAGEATGFSAILSGDRRGALGISYQLLDVGTQDLTDPDRNVVGSISVRSHQALLSGGIKVGGRSRVGANVKSIQYRVSCRGQCPDGTVSATSYAVDLGVQSQPFRSIPLELGLMVAHLGGDFQVAQSEQADPLPARIRLGAAYDVLDAFVEENLSMRVLTEVEDRLWDPGTISLFLGTEFLASAGAVDEVSVRGGYVFGNRNQTDGAGVGFGARYERFEFGIARSLARGGPTSGNEPVHFTLGFLF